jgi:hypothetical protein
MHHPQVAGYASFKTSCQQTSLFNDMLPEDGALAPNIDQSSTRNEQP